MKLMTEDAKWKKIKTLLDAGMSVTDICRTSGVNVTPAQIYGRRTKWQRQAYQTDSKYAKYHTPAYKKWRTSVLTRDKFRCIICKRGRGQVKALQADHIKSWSRFPELRYNVANGRTLCVYHHKRTLNYGFKANTCNDELNGRSWEIKERLLWKAKQEKASLVSKQPRKSKRRKTPLRRTFSGPR